MKPNPFIMVYGALWDLLLAHPYFKTIRPGNLIRFDDPTNRNVIKPQIVSGDVPEVMLMIEGTQINLQDSSSTSKCVRTYSWQIATGDLRYSELMGNLEWSLFCAMANWPKHVTALRWKEKAFAKRVSISAGETGIAVASLNRDLRGWAAVWRCEVEMHFLTSDLLEFCNDSA